MNDMPNTGSLFVVENNEPSDFFIRLNNMGITEGTRLYIKAKSPSGDPLIITARNVDFAVRKKNLLSLRLRREDENCHNR